MPLPTHITAFSPMQKAPTFAEASAHF